MNPSWAMLAVVVIVNIAGVAAMWGIGGQKLQDLSRRVELIDGKDGSDQRQWVEIGHLGQRVTYVEARQNGKSDV